MQKVPDSCYMSKAGADTIVTTMLAFLTKPHIVVTFDLNSLVFIAYPCDPKLSYPLLDIKLNFPKT